MNTDKKTSRKSADQTETSWRIQREFDVIRVHLYYYA
jgi:hypothetical protein